MFSLAALSAQQRRPQSILGLATRTRAPAASFRQTLSKSWQRLRPIPSMRMPNDEDPPTRTNNRSVFCVIGTCRWADERLSPERPNFHVVRHLDEPRREIPGLLWNPLRSGRRWRIRWHSGQQLGGRRRRRRWIGAAVRPDQRGSSERVSGSYDRGWWSRGRTRLYKYFSREQRDSRR